MKIDRHLNTLSYSEYIHLLKRYQRFADFNHLGLFRSIIENSKLSLTEKIEIRDTAVDTFPKFFNFLQVKDPRTYMQLEMLGQNLTVADEQRIWDVIQANQQKILANKKIKHRNFGTYSKHSCGYATCHLNNIMVKQGSLLTESDMRFQSDKGYKYSTFSKSERRKQERKQQRQLIQEDLARDI